jgi:hypothetical protein
MNVLIVKEQISLPCVHDLFDLACYKSKTEKIIYQWCRRGDSNSHKETLTTT